MILTHIALLHGNFIESNLLEIFCVIKIEREVTKRYLYYDLSVQYRQLLILVKMTNVSALFGYCFMHYQYVCTFVQYKQFVQYNFLNHLSGTPPQLVDLGTIFLLSHTEDLKNAIHSLPASLLAAKSME